MMKLTGFGLGLALVCTFILSCKDDEKAKFGRASISFANSGTAPHVSSQKLMDNDVTPTTPDVLGMKMISLYLVEDLADDGYSNKGVAAMLWKNEKCDTDLSRCSIGGSGGEYQVEDYFDFARSTAEVNAELNSQKQEFPVGTYRYIRADFSGIIDEDTESDIPNLKFGKIVDGEETTYEVRPNWGNGYTARLSMPIEIAENDSITVTMTYDFSDSFYDDETLRENPDDAPNGYLDNWFCGGEETDDGNGNYYGPCIHFKGFTPSATKD